MRIVASDGHSHATEGQTSTNLFFSKPGEEVDQVVLSNLYTREKNRGVIDDRLYQTLWVMDSSVNVISISRISNMCRWL